MIQKKETKDLELPDGDFYPDVPERHSRIFQRKFPTFLESNLRGSQPELELLSSRAQARPGPDGLEKISPGKKFKISQPTLMPVIKCCTDNKVYKEELVYGNCCFTFL